MEPILIKAIDAYICSYEKKDSILLYMRDAALNRAQFLNGHTVGFPDKFQVLYGIFILYLAVIVIVEFDS